MTNVPMDPDRLSLLAGAVAPSAEPTLTIFGTPTRAAVLVLHGGRAHSRAPTRPTQLAYRRMVPIARALHATLRTDGVGVCLLRNRMRGWNEPALDAVADADWALGRLTRDQPELPIVLVGHSMGGRAALRVAGDRRVVAVCALAPWLTRSDPVEQLAGRRILIAHGDRDRWTDPRASHAYALRARDHTDVARFEVARDGHTMLRRAHEWTRLITGFVAGALGVGDEPESITRAFGSPEGLRQPL